ncbi:MAG: DUF1800 domain-containing protein [Burkholderiaceae bacterium]
MSSATLAAIAAHRFGLGEADLAVVGDDPRGWLLAQVGAADAQRGDGLVDAAEGLRRHDAFLRRLRTPQSAQAMMDGKPVEQTFVDHFRDAVQADLAARLGTAAATSRPFAERLALFWCNHFTVSMAKASTRGLVGAFEREAIRPHIAGHFEHLLAASTRHAAMLRYLDNALSAGPHSRFVTRLAQRERADDDRGPRITGLNENLAREILELHTLGVDGGYTQADVTAFAGVLTGWRAPRLPRGSEASFFDAAWHEPGPKTVLGKTYASGPDALERVLHDLALHPATARFIANKLARHFVADDPPPALVQRLARTFADTAGHLPTVYSELVRAPEAWSPQRAKLKSPEEFVISTARLLPRGDALVARGRDGGIAQLGQRVQAAPSPAGWPDRADEWLGPEAVWKRLEWATRVGERYGRLVDARAIGQRALGDTLSADTAQQVARAADGSQALTLLLMSPEFQRR